jgi:septal ring factor EnvC (AmiA/AmiB activator)
MTQATDTELLTKIAADISAIKISQARIEERFNSIDQRFDAVDQKIDALDKSLSQRIDALDSSLNKRIDSLEQRGNGQETRFWGLVAILSTTLLGILGKVVFFPVDKL